MDGAAPDWPLLAGFVSTHHPQYLQHWLKKLGKKQRGPAEICAAAELQQEEFRALALYGGPMTLRDGTVSTGEAARGASSVESSSRGYQSGYFKISPPARPPRHADSKSAAIRTSPIKHRTPSSLQLTTISHQGLHDIRGTSVSPPISSHSPV